MSLQPYYECKKEHNEILQVSWGGWKKDEAKRSTWKALLGDLC